LGSTCQQAGYNLREKGNQENYGSGHPEQRYADRAALPALIVPTIQLNKPHDQQDGCTTDKPITE
jgi:hypothetical protein